MIARYQRELLLGPPGEQYRVHDKVRRLNELGFEVADLEFGPAPDGEQLMATGKSVAAIRWRTTCFEPLINRLSRDFPDQNPVNRSQPLLG